MLDKDAKGFFYLDRTPKKEGDLKTQLTIAGNFCYSLLSIKKWLDKNLCISSLPSTGIASKNNMSIEEMRNIPCYDAHMIFQSTIYFPLLFSFLKSSTELDRNLIMNK